MPPLVELTVAVPPPFPCPATLSEGAWPVFEAVVAQAGATVYRMPTSCDFLLKRHLAAFPRERELLSLALHRGVPEAAAKRGADHAQLAGDLAAAAGTPADEALWAVNAWAATVGPSPLAAPKVKAKQMSDAVVVGATAERGIMTAIAAVGGLLGGGVGNGSLLLLMSLFDGGSVQYRVTRDGVTGPAMDGGLSILIALSMGTGALLGAAGAALGWWMGRGNERPWAGFAAAWGAGMGTGSLFLFITGPGPITAAIIGVATFGATYTAAARGGRTN